jgi:hypothetical protein
MREVNASHARIGDIELRLEPMPPRSADDGAPLREPTPEEIERSELAALLHSTDVDIDALLKRKRAA